MINSLQNATRKIYTTIFSAPTKSQFYDTGRLTPEEFIKAGDQLVTSCPSWQWKSAKDDKHRKNEFPPDKQYLFTEVTCEKRVKDAIETKLIEKDLGNGWAMTESDQEKTCPTANQSIKINMDELEGLEPSQENPNIQETNDNDNDNDEYIEQEIDGMILKVKVTNKGKSDGVKEAQQKEEVKIEEKFEKIDLDNIDQTRKYHLSITYDFFYLTPRLWLVGYDSEGNLLTEKEMYEDIMDEYANKTVTYEYHPHIGMNQLSIHPCKHADVMKHLIDVASDNGIKVEVHQSMFIFLKFISSVVPTMEYDFTVDFEFGSSSNNNNNTNSTTSQQIEKN